MDKFKQIEQEIKTLKELFVLAKTEFQKNLIIDFIYKKEQSVRNLRFREKQNEKKKNK